MKNSNIFTKIMFTKILYIGVALSSVLAHATGATQDPKLDLPRPACTTMTKQDLEFVIVVPTYNNIKWVKRNLDSLIHQKTDGPYSFTYSIICVDDCSVDGTSKALDDYAKEHT